jgi:hypothetical protein
VNRSTDLAFHSVQLSVTEVCKRWPARDRLQAAFPGYDQEAAESEGWMTEFGAQRFNVIKQVPCNGLPTCALCSGSVRPIDLP